MPLLKDPDLETFLDNELKKAFEQFSQRNPTSLKAHRDAHQHLPGGNTRTVIHATPFPITWQSGQNAWLTSADGHTYLDMLGEFSAGVFGHSDPRIVESVKKSLLSGWNFGGNSWYEKRLAEVMCKRFGPSGVDLVRFTNSGTEANTTALGAALAITGKKKILVFSGGYHGSTLVFPMTLMKGTTKAPMNLPHQFIYAPYNNVTETDAIVGQFKDNLAAILVEPVQGSGGCRPATKVFMQYLRRLADSTGAVLVIDEVMVSRLGPSGCSATLGVKGDLITLGKYIGGGMTIGAFGGRRDIMELFDPARNELFHPGTFNNNVISMNAGMTGLEIFNADAVKRLNQLGDKLKNNVQRILIDEKVYPESVQDADVDLIEIDGLSSKSMVQAGPETSLPILPPMSITGRGSMLNVRFSGPDAVTWQALFYHHMLANNVNVAVRGYTPLHLRLSDVEIEQYVAAIRDFVLKYKEHLSHQD